MKIYTKRGDRGETSLLGGEPASKASPRVCAYGDVDELNAALGLARTHLAPRDGELDAILAGLQSALFDLGAELATPPGGPGKASTPVGTEDVARLERIIDRLQDGLEPQTHFVLPGGSPAAAALHLARTVCRRAERSVVALREKAPRTRGTPGSPPAAGPSGSEPVGADALVFLNRLSDLLFVMARAANARVGVADVPWIARRPG